MPHLAVTHTKHLTLPIHFTEGHTDELTVQLAQGVPAAFTMVLNEGNIWQYLETFIAWH